MFTLTHYRLCPKSRSLRLASTELKLEHRLIEQEPWAIDAKFLAQNPAGELPVVEIDGGPVLCGVYSASEYLCCDLPHYCKASTPPLALFAENADDRAEVRRLVDWFHNKFDRDATRELLFEKIYQRMTPGNNQGPNSDILRVARANLKYHLSYISFLADQRTWLAGDSMTFADLSAAAHISSLDYIGEIDWQAYPVAKSWYQKIKSRPAFRPLLSDRIAGILPPPHYADLDF